MTVSALKKRHAREASKAAALYLQSRTPVKEAVVWHLALKQARDQIDAALKASKMLTNVEAALESDGGHMLAFRHLLAPPISQDQFRILCPSWPKGTEKSGGGMSHTSAAAVAVTFRSWRDKQLTAWIDTGSIPTRQELHQVKTAVAPLMASQAFNTSLRNIFAKDQESAVIDILKKAGWKKVPSKLVDTRAALGPKEYMHKTRFATNTSRPQEVDVACGLKGTFVLAMECKVTNDETNSVKRINDVLKKASAWKAHWGSFVETAALLQGVISAKDVERLIDAGVHVFWSHDLGIFKTWISKRA